MFVLQRMIEKDASCMVFASTKHHVDYLQHLLNIAGIEATYIYGALDQQARKIHLARFRNGRVKLMIVTDVAARGLDIPLLDYVINYDFPSQPKVFVHRVGRVARAGKKGTAISFVQPDDIAHLLDFQLFSGRPFVLCSKEKSSLQTASASLNPADSHLSSICIGTIPAFLLDMNIELALNLRREDVTLDTFYKSAQNAAKLYAKTKSTASAESYKRAKTVAIASIGTHPVLGAFVEDGAVEKENFIFRLSQYRPNETIFEVGKRGANSIEAQVVKKRRKVLDKGYSKNENEKSLFGNEKSLVGNEKSLVGNEKSLDSSYKDIDYFMSHFAGDVDSAAYAIKTKPENFVEEAKYATLDLNGDDGKRSGPVWDAKKRKFMTKTVGADNKKMIRTESGRLIAASYKTDRFESWQKKTKISIPRSGEKELPQSKTLLQTKRFKHNKTSLPKPFSHKSQRKATLSTDESKKEGNRRDGNRGDRIRDGNREDRKRDGKGAGRNPAKILSATRKPANIKSELKNAQQISKERAIKASRKAKNARPSKKPKR